MEQLIPIPTLHLFRTLDELLIELLLSLSPADWQKPTLAMLWSVKDVAAHLLDGNLRGIANLHNYDAPVTGKILSYQDIINHLNQLNAVWVDAMKRVSPKWLIAQLSSTGPQYIQYLTSLDPFSIAKYPVAWAGQEQSYNWFHVAREYTEKWHHQQQIRDAVGKEAPLMLPEIFYPVIATFMCALHIAIKILLPPQGSILKITIDGLPNGSWQLIKTNSCWQLTKSLATRITSAHITIQPEIAWKIFTKAIPPAVAASKSIIAGSKKLADGIFNMVAVMA
ncbi:maleylpyruvate isomerase N-terminal domain-containing protein [Mucilaginibacter glaciei]|uniref:Maleylpyruvate isomerase N-terminal domain-containing protein n=1 Tax=Mucilaginibacter glaciei TaxID=2772109 RepID=A0A926NUY9_9SPHI|nr:maleylpyruvate isomerase N-terminal domain-containing protein [Mucilaginibacter glaciei]MBD1392194.1 maleylpyruvate isomerase N-terminal domain-containing protein [Mucilaginibacter glaciei]